jgi:glutamate racemase
LLKCSRRIEEKGLALRRPIIGVFDSGVGGLTVLRELIEQVPNADYLYFGDTARLPYGSKSVQTVAKYAISSANYLQQQGAEHLVIACNTASALALDAITKAVSIDVIGVIEPGAKAAAAVTKSRKAVVIATEGTVSSHAYQNALHKLGISAKEKACPLFVPLVEEGWIEHSVTETIAHIYLDDQFQAESEGWDTLVLGCTHYPLLKPLLRRVVPSTVSIVDSAESTAQVMAKKFGSSNGVSPSIRFFATDSVEKFRRAGEKFLGRKIEDVSHVDMDT